MCYNEFVPERDKKKRQGKVSKTGKGITMTNREFFEAIMNNEELSNDLRGHAARRLSDLNRANENRKSKPRTVKPETLAFLEKIREILRGSGKFVTAAEVAETLSVSTQKASAAFRNLHSTGEVEELPVKPEGTKHYVKGYRLAEVGQLTQTVEAEA